MKLVNILIASYTLSYSPPGSCPLSCSSTSYPLYVTRNRTRHQVKTTILLIDILLTVSCHHTRVVICPALSDTLRAALIMSQSSPTYLSHLTRCRTRRRDPAHHHRHRHHTPRLLLTIVLAARLRPPFSSSTPWSLYLVIIHQQKNSASGCKGCIQTLYMHLKRLDARDAT